MAELGLRRTTGNRVYEESYRGFESLSLRQEEPCKSMVLSFSICERIVKCSMKPEQYLNDPCGASSLPFWKTNAVTVPPSIAVVRDDAFRGTDGSCFDTPYFRMIRRLSGLSKQNIPSGYSLVDADAETFALHIQSCYERESVSAEELDRSFQRSEYHADLRIAVRDDASGRIAASGIAALDETIREGILDWIQVSPEYRRRRLGRFVVNELLFRMRDKADFVTVSGRLHSSSNPFALYQSCGFSDPVIWHVIRQLPRDEAKFNKENCHV